MKHLFNRNKLITEAYRNEGKSVKDLALEYGLTPQRIRMIVLNFSMRYDIPLLYKFKVKYGMSDRDFEELLRYVRKLIRRGEED